MKRLKGIFKKWNDHWNSLSVTYSQDLKPQKADLLFVRQPLEDLEGTGPKFDLENIIWQRKQTI